MVTATRSSATARHRRSHEFYPMRAQFVPNGPSMNTTSSQVSYDTEIPNVDELRRVRAQCYNTKSEDRRKKPQKEMASYTSQRRESISRSMSARIPEVTVREGRRKHETTHRRRRERAKEDGDEGKVYVYRYVDDDPRDDPTTRSTLRRRASAPKSSKLEPSRSYINESDLSRRQTERRLSHRRDWESSTSRNQRRSSSSANILPSIAR